MSTLAYEIVNVFTDRPFAGNPLAVVFGAEALAAEQMQTVAREFNLSETVFVLPAASSTASYRARIFTPTQELPFAGHPSIGAAVTAVRRGVCRPGQVIQECGAGPLPLEVTADGVATLTGGSPTVGPEMDPADLLRSISLDLADFVGPMPRLAGCGLEFAFLSVRPDAVARAALAPATSTAEDFPNISVFAWEAASRTVHARVFCPAIGVPEDPATGSAALGFGVWAVASGVLPGEGRSSYVVYQGAELRRPSVLSCTVTAVDGAAVGATVSGRVVPIARGVIAVPPFIG